MMRRGEIRVVNFAPSRGSEASKSRPAVVVSNDSLNTAVTMYGRGVITVVPLTSNTDRALSFQVVLPLDASGLSKDSKAQVEQLRAVSIDEVGPVIGEVRGEHLAQLDEALRMHLQLW